MQNPLLGSRVLAVDSFSPLSINILGLVMSTSMWTLPKPRGENQSVAGVHELRGGGSVS